MRGILSFRTLYFYSLAYVTSFLYHLRPSCLFDHPLEKDIPSKSIQNAMDHFKSIIQITPKTKANY